MKKGYPSITKQTDFDCYMVDFGKALHVTNPPSYFNPSLFFHDGSDWLFARRCDMWWDKANWMNSIWAFKLGERNPVFGTKVGLAGYPKQHFEDPRISVIGGSPWISYCTFVEDRGRWFGAHQGLAMLNNDLQPERMFDPVWGGNGGSVLMNEGNEKNWLWFDHDGHIHCIYMTEPHQVVSWDNEINPMDRFETGAEMFSDWSIKWGHVRGGTPPIRIDNLYWSFFHSSVDGGAPNGKRRYFMGAYAFEATQPFAIKRVSKAPILVGSEEDPWHPIAPLVVFPCGSIFRNNEWTISLGVNDFASAIIKIPHEAIEEEAEGRPITIAPWHNRLSEVDHPVAKRRRGCRIRRRKPRKARVARDPGDPARQQPSPHPGIATQCDGGTGIEGTGVH